MKKKAYSVLNVVSAIAITAVAVSVVAAGSKIIGKADNIADQWKAQTATQSSSQTSQPAYCSGGTIDSTSDPGYIVHLFTEVGTNFQFSCTSNKSVEYLVVGGGGGTYTPGSRRYGGGGGGGDVASGSTSITSGVNYIIAVGDGGAAGGVGSPGSSGESSSITFNQTIIAQSNGGTGGSSTKGGDSGNSFSGAYGASGASGEFGGGGGGSNGNGNNPTYNTSGSGGNGIVNNITGTLLEYGKGGTGDSSVTVSPQSGPANSGWGAEGGGASGGSGIVVIRYSST